MAPTSNRGKTKKAQELALKRGIPLPGTPDPEITARLSNIQRTELRTKAYQLYSTNMSISGIATELKITPGKVTQLLAEAIEQFAVLSGEEATKRLVSYAEAALTALEPKVNNGDVAAHRVAAKWIETLMNLYGVGPASKVEVTSTSTVVHVKAEELPVMKALEAYKAQNLAIEGELAEIAPSVPQKKPYDHKNFLPPDVEVFSPEELARVYAERPDGD